MPLASLLFLAALRFSQANLLDDIHRIEKRQEDLKTLSLVENSKFGENDWKTPKSAAKILIIGGCCSPETYELFYPDNLELNRVLNFNFPPIWNHASSKLPNGQIITSGGTSNGQILSTVPQFDPNTFEITELPPLQTARELHASVILQGKVVICGGWDKFANVLSSCEIMDRNRWHFITPMQQERSDLSMVEMDNLIYVFGGVSQDREPLDSAEKYNFQTKKWQNIASIPRATFGASAAVLEGKINFCGGANYFETFDVCRQYEPKSDTWIATENMNEKRSNFGLVSLENRLVAIGGRGGLKAPFSAEVWEPEFGNWTNLEGGPLKMRFGFSAVLI